jgi:two-component system response regulator AtoC
MRQICSSSGWDDVTMSAASEAPILISADDSIDAKALGAWIHALSPRRTGRLVVLDAHGLGPDVRFEDFEPARARSESFRAADRLSGGTLLLENLEAMPLGTQTKLCRFLDRRAISVPPTLRVVATTDRLVHERVQSGQIREELFYRLNVIHLVLRENGTIAQRQKTHGDMTLRNLVTWSGARITLQ